MSARQCAATCCDIAVCVAAAVLRNSSVGPRSKEGRPADTGPDTKDESRCITKGASFMNGEGSSPAAASAEDQDKNAARWRRAILNLSETLLSACDERQDLSPFLMEAMHSALENLLVYGEADDLMALEEWLNEEKPGSHRHAQADHEAPESGEQSPVTQPLAASSGNAPLADSSAAKRISQTPFAIVKVTANPPQSNTSSSLWAASDLQAPPAETTAPAVERRVHGERRVHNERRGVPRLNGEYRSGRDRRSSPAPGLSGNKQTAPQDAAPQEQNSDKRDAQPSSTASPTTR